ncbi:uncharacterized protein THITE_2109894 [Thermothielavioides terrestris NRRL 8126]|uniref:Uncharacterized protein n=1 Tax=Thermothielavioides terrestris (strain ATCC 38088 / NRRL 8126) TaxID=578455 RepID=G2QQU7_THETT|nr:uncharacterized protein THITE_2109894 [Thermothielavioides terrestris NRRL 8126]AEO64106.1 hypothetical protein THITE_2109894 [Thermothielavioides terrestris NRRL 8126]
MDDAVPTSTLGEGLATGAPQNALLDFFFPGFSMVSSAVSKYLHIDLNLYIPLVLLFGGLTFAWRYFSEYFSGLVESHLMSAVDIRPDDEIYNMLMAWVANQRFAQSARRFVVNTNLNSRSWFLWRWNDDDADSEEDDGPSVGRKKKKRVLAYTPTFGSHWFLYKGRLLIFRRLQNQQHSPYLTLSEREEISISCFGRDPWVLKELLHEARDYYVKRDEAKTLIYQGTTRSGSCEPQWQRCMVRTPRPLSTVILNEQVKKELIDDVTDYLNPATRRWYANRGIPYRRGYLLYGPPGTGKSSLSLALAGFFKMRIYIVSLNSVTANEENLATLFAELPRRCVVLLEDIDTAGLTHTRDGENQADNAVNNDEEAPTRNRRQPGTNNNNNNNNPNNTTGRLSLSGLLNILDGVASTEGRVLIMTTNHLEKLDKALIRPGRVDMMVKFGRADAGMTAAIFRAIYAPLEGDDGITAGAGSASSPSASTSRALFQLERSLKPAALRSAEEEGKREAEAAEAARRKEETIARVNALAEQFAAKIPAHEFSPAEIQGFLLKNKRDPEKAVEGAEQWVVDTRKEKKEKELKEAQEKREKEEKEKEKEEEEKRKKKEKKDKKKGKKESSKRKAKKSSSSRSKKKTSSDSEVGSGSSSSSDEAENESESEREKEKETAKKTAMTTTTTSKPAASAPAAADADADADTPAQLKETGSSEVEAKAKVEPAVTTPAVTVTIDMDKAKEAAVEAQRTPQSVDSGYGTP